MWLCFIGNYKNTTICEERLILRNKVMKSNFYKLLFGAPKCNAPLECKVEVKMLKC